ncbi:chitobiase/beta-hexosaminidase C-terminal domain-containing protein [Pontiella sp. NLcol2]|uniref:Chitobiase/beta-hexosaminidase C-terminal domain-containing protein n=1 Tax=Pontiella agarivorans TaxID=3038953 RepID=A0ABU5N1F6_9BACT|nr:chitobiase/beta-hexosaminidase C-terminal domain-containing protein [Pontiella agarivorans]
MSIDVQLLPLRGKAPKANVDIYYTVDGTEPTAESTRYAGTFPVTLGTMVKALVVLDGLPVLNLDERFAAGEGFVWKSSVKASEIPAGEQAERAVFTGAVREGKAHGRIFRGEGYIRFTGEADASVQ